MLTLPESVLDKAARELQLYTEVQVCPNAVLGAHVTTRIQAMSSVKAQARYIGDAQADGDSVDTM